MTTNQECPIFNFNIYPCFSLAEHMNYIRPLEHTQLFLDPNNGLTSFKYNRARTSGGIKLRLGTIPGEIYHIYVTGQLLIGDFVHMTVENHGPTINLDKPKRWKMGCDEVRTMCFTALSQQTLIYFKTPQSCFINNSPYEFILSQLDIIPDTLSCQGFIRGATGPTGDSGNIAIPGPQGALEIGPIGTEGQGGPDGEPGFDGETGEPGIIGGIGSIGGIGLEGLQGSVRGPQGDQGEPGAMGGIGPIGFTGVQGNQGVQGAIGRPSYITGENIVIGQFELRWTRGGDATIAINFATFQRISNMVILRLSPFSCVGTSGFDFACLHSTSMPNNIRTLEFRNSFFPAIIEVGVNANSLVAKNVIIEVGPAILIIYSDMNFGCEFEPAQVVFFPEQTFTYYKDDVEI